MEKEIIIRSFDTHLDEKEWEKIERFPVIAVLENLRSAFNVGSIIRTADSALLSQVICCGITAHPPHLKLEKTSMGSIDYVKCDYSVSALDSVKKLKKEGVKIYSMETTNLSKLIWDVDFTLPAALVMGNEALGVSKDILEISDEILEIPMLGYKNSMNVSVAFGIAVYEIRKRFWNSFPKDSWMKKLDDWPNYIQG
ncbi:RNA methyltransferase [bacterium]|nr:RNA methyltransferase [bacterium]